MSLTRRRFNQTLLGGLGLLVLPAAWAELVEGRDWRMLADAPAGTPEGKIEILKFFSYGCPFCSQMNRAMHSWEEGLPDDVAFRRVPVSFNRAAWSSLSRLYFALEATGEVARLHQEAFDAVQRRELTTDRSIIDWAEKNGVDKESFSQAFNASHTSSMVARSDRLQAQFDIRSVPTLVVDGRYVVVGEGAATYKDLMDIADALVEKARQERLANSGN